MQHGSVFCVCSPSFPLSFTCGPHKWAFKQKEKSRLLRILRNRTPDSETGLYGHYSLDKFWGIQKRLLFFTSKRKMGDIEQQFNIPRRFQNKTFNSPRRFQNKTFNIPRRFQNKTEDFLQKK